MLAMLGEGQAAGDQVLGTHLLYFFFFWMLLPSPLVSFFYFLSLLLRSAFWFGVGAGIGEW